MFQIKHFFIYNKIDFNVFRKILLTYQIKKFFEIYNLEFFKYLKLMSFKFIKNYI